MGDDTLTARRRCLAYRFTFLEKDDPEAEMRPNDPPSCIVRKSAEKNGEMMPERTVIDIDQYVMNMITLMFHDVRGNLVSLGAALRLMNRGVYGEMDDGVSTEVRKLCSRVSGMMGMLEEFMGEALSIKGYLETSQELLYLGRDVVDPVLDELSVDIRNGRIDLHKELKAPSGKHIAIKGKKIWLKAVFRNLLTNAVKYGGRGCRITVGIKESGRFLRLNVFNSGNPIPNEERGKLFTAGLGARMSGSPTGMGVGLYLSRQIIRQHGGDMWYEAPADGSNFVFLLPRD